MPIKSLIVPCEIDECTGVVAVVLLRPRAQNLCPTCVEQLAECEIPFAACGDSSRVPAELRSN